MNSEDMSDIIKKINTFAKDNNISQDNINNVFNMFNNQSKDNSSTSSDNNTTSENQNFNNNIDFETIIKMKKIIDKMNTKDDPRSNLLKSLKPYLNESRKSKVDQYIQLMNMSKVMDVFPFMNGGNSNDK